MNLDHFSTERLILHRPVPADEPDLWRMFTEPRVMATLGGMRTPDDTRRLIDRTFAHWLCHEFGLWILRDRATQQFVGRGGLRAMVIAGRPEIELGYALMPEFWGRGLATEVARKSVQVGWETLGANDMVCFTQEDNKGSLNVMRKVGFVYEREAPIFGLPQLIHRLRK